MHANPLTFKTDLQLYSGNMLVTLMFLYASKITYCLQPLQGYTELYSCNKPVSSQYWELRAIGDGTHVIVNNKTRGEDKCKEGSKILAYSHLYKNNNQKWYIGYDGQITPACNKSMVLTVKGNEVWDGTRLTLASRSNGSERQQKFIITPAAE
ncbi:unidentified ricin-domain protein [Rhyzopertha dominica]|nr:unidentified ricin-domain protein [Rhyzopertha dominica]